MSTTASPRGAAQTEIGAAADGGAGAAGSERQRQLLLVLDRRVIVPIAPRAKELDISRTECAEGDLATTGFRTNFDPATTTKENR